MSKSVIGSLRVNLGLDSAQFSRGLSQAQKNLKAASMQFAAVSGAATVAFAAVSAAALQGARAIDDAAKAARRIDSSVAGFRALEMAADDAGVSLSSLANDIQTMSREIAKGSDGAQKALKTLGIAASDLEGLDADQKMALIADSVKELGLTSGQASVLLQQLGVRNREMALLVIGGGDALRQARVDVEEFGLAISDVDAARIEAANDELAGLADITAYVGDQLALKFVPAMGDAAKAMTDSLREGGLLRNVLDAMIGSLDRVATYVGVIVTGFGVRYVAALAAARLATLSFAGSLALLRTALIRTGIGALVVAAGELVLWLGRAVKSVGGVGNAFELLAAQGQASAYAIQTFFLDSILAISTGFIQLTQDFAKGMNQVFSTNLQGLDFGMLGNSAMSGELTGIAGAAINARQKMQDAESAAASLKTRIAEAGDVTSDTSDSIEVINDALTDTSKSAGAAAKELKALQEEALQLNLDADPVARYNAQIERLGELVQAGLSDGAFAKGLADARDELAKSMPVVQSFSDAFEGFLNGSITSFKDFASQIFQDFRNLLAQMITTAARNRILIGMGFGGSVAGTAAQAATSGAGMLGGIGAGVGAFAGGIGSGLSVVGSGFAAGGLSGAATAGMGAFTGGIGMGGMAGFGTALGAAIPVIGAVALVFGALRKTTKELDSGVNVAVQGLSVAAEAFRTTQTSRFFGLSRSTRTSTTDDPVVAGTVSEMQNAVVEMARQLDVGAQAFDGFTYDFQVSLKGLSQEDAAQRVAEQVGMLGDAFAGMIPHIADLNELMSTVQERFQLETRLLQLQGDTAALRERELQSVNALNRDILQRIYDFQDASDAAAEASQKAVETAAAGNAAIQRTMDLFRAPLTLDSERFTDRFSATIQAAEDRRSQVQKEAEGAQLTELKLMRNILDELRRDQRDMRLYGSVV